MEFSAKQIDDFIHGKIEGDENATVNTFAKIEEGKKGAISFLSNPKYTHYLYDTESSVVLVDEALELTRQTKATLIRVSNAYESVAKLLQLYESMKPKKQGIDSYPQPQKLVKAVMSEHLHILVTMLKSVTIVKYILMPQYMTTLRLATIVLYIQMHQYIMIVGLATMSHCIPDV